MSISKPTLLVVFSGMLLFACKNESEDITDSVNKDGSVETAVQVNHIDSLHDELVTTHRIWVKHSVYKTTEYRDTLPALEKENRVAEDEEGDSRGVAVQKDYEIYITVK